MRLEQEQLLKKAQDSLNAAHLLYNDGYYEFAVSRTYYTMFYIAQIFLLNLELTFSKHSAVISGFGKEFISSNKIDKKFHRYLIDAQNIRNIGDYDTVTEVLKEDASIELLRAHEFIELVKSQLD